MFSRKWYGKIRTLLQCGRCRANRAGGTTNVQHVTHLQTKQCQNDPITTAIGRLNFTHFCFFAPLINAYQHKKRNIPQSSFPQKWTQHTRTHTHTQPLNGLLSGTTQVGRYQKKHSPTHTHPDHRTSFIIFLHLQRSMASSLFSLRD